MNKKIIPYIPLPPPKGQTPGWGGVAHIRCTICHEYTDMFLETAQSWPSKTFICRKCRLEGHEPNVIDPDSFIIIKLSNGKYFSLAYPGGTDHVRLALNFPSRLDSSWSHIAIQLRDICLQKNIPWEIFENGYTLIKVKTSLIELKLR